MLRASTSSPTRVRPCRGRTTSALRKVLQALLDAHELCVIGSEEKIEEQKEMFLEIKTL